MHLTKHQPSNHSDKRAPKEKFKTQLRIYVYIMNTFHFLCVFRRYWTMERQELIGQAGATASTAASAAPDDAAADEVLKATPRAGQHRRGYRASGGGRAKRRPLFYAHCASAQQTLLHMTIAKGIKQILAQ